MVTKNVRFPFALASGYLQEGGARILHTLGFGELVWIETPSRKVAAFFGGQDVEEVWERWV